MIMSGIEKKGYDKGISESFKKIMNYFINEGFTKTEARKKALKILSLTEIPS